MPMPSVATHGLGHAFAQITVGLRRASHALGQRDVLPDSMVGRWCHA